MTIDERRPESATGALVLDVSCDMAVATVRAAGDIDLGSADQLSVVITRLSSNGHRNVVLDLARVGFCDASGLRALLMANERLRSAGGHLTVIGASPLLHHIMTITQLTDVLDVR